MLSIQRESMFRQKNSRSEIIATVLVLSYCLVPQNRVEDKFGEAFYIISQNSEHSCGALPNGRRKSKTGSTYRPASVKVTLSSSLMVTMILDVKNCCYPKSSELFSCLPRICLRSKEKLTYN